MSIVTDSSILHSDKPFFIPDFAGRFTIHTGLAIHINRLGKNISSRFASRYYDAATACVMVEAQDHHDAIAPGDARLTGFDGSMMLGDFITFDKLANVEDIHIDTFINNEKTGNFNSQAMKIDLAHLIETSSRYFTLKMGDVIAIGNFNESHTLNIGDRLTSTINGIESLIIRIK